MPQSALFILFDAIIEYSNHVETKNNLSYLQILVAYFARLAHATGIDLFISVPGEFFQIATNFVQEMEANSTSFLPHNPITLEDFAREDEAQPHGTEGQQIFRNDRFGFQASISSCCLWYWF